MIHNPWDSETETDFYKWMRDKSLGDAGGMLYTFLSIENVKLDEDYNEYHARVHYRQGEHAKNEDLIFTVVEQEGGKKVLLHAGKYI